MVRGVLVRSRRLAVSPDELVGRRLTGADSFGKNVLLLVEGYAVRIHPMMYGRVLVLERGEHHGRPERQVRLVMELDDCYVVALNTPIVEVGRADELLRGLRESLGPDPYRDDWSRDEALRRIRERGLGRRIGEVLLDQSVIAGVGNILRNEILFRAGISPERGVDGLSDGELLRLLEVTEQLFKEFLALALEGRRLREHLLVYNRYGKPCPRCGGPIVYYRQRPHNRKTFYCPRCQR